MKHLLGITIVMCIASQAGAVPVIYDTDIGSDIDDTWALGHILSSEELDLKLVVTDSDNTEGKAKLAAKFLERVGRADVAVGIGVKQNEHVGAQASWAKDYALDQYPGTVHQDGIGAMIDVIENATETVVLLVVGPCPNIPVLLERAPHVVEKVKVVAMSGSVDIGYNGVVTPDAEYNVRHNVPAAQVLYSAGWDLTIAPLDTAGTVRITGLRYQKLIESQSRVFETIRDAYRVWNDTGDHGFIPDSHSSVLYDTVAVYLAYAQDFCRMEEMKLVVTDTGFTKRSKEGKTVHVAIDWKDKEAFLDHLVKRLSSGVVNARFPEEENVSKEP